MRFLIPAQTIAEHKHHQMPVFETLGLSAGSAALIGGALGAAGGIGGALLSKSGSGGMPSYNPQQALDFQKQQFNQMSPQALGFGSQAFNQAQQQGIDFSKLGTATNIANQEAVMPGSQTQRQLAQGQINSYIQGQIPQDVQQQIQRNVAQGVGGGFNLFSGGGMAPQNFARNIGQTSVGLSQFGLSAAPTWQQLANTMVVSPTAGLSAGLQATGMGANLASSAAGLGQQQAENQYQSQANQYAQNQMQNQNLLNMGISGAQTGLGFANSLNTANYLQGLSGMGAQNTLGAIPSASQASSYMSSLGYNPSAMSSIPNLGLGTQYPFG
jgi:hypothetical protein